VPLGAAAPTAREKAQRDYDVAISAQKSAAAERDVLRKQISEGQVLAPVAGRVLKVPVTAGTVVMPGETLAVIANEHYILRLQVPERHARFIRAGDPVRLDQSELGSKAAAIGKIVLVYPQIDNGRVVADAEVENLGNYFVGRAGARLDFWG
jgi:multidrug efflux pump subunit AcrA (membrane-fusion protein)